MNVRHVWALAGGSKNENAPIEAEDTKEASEVENTETDETNGEDSEPKPEPEPEPEAEPEQEENGGESTQTTFSYEQLRAKSDNPVTGIDFKRREVSCSIVRIMLKLSILFYVHLITNM